MMDGSIYDLLDGTSVMCKFLYYVALSDYLRSYNTFTISPN